MRILVTGACGFIGRRVIARLANAHDVVGVDIAEPVHAELAGLRILTRDLRSADALNDCEDFEAVLHLAALPSVPRSVRDPQATFGHCVIATVNLLEWARARHVPRIVFSSSSSVYGGLLASTPTGLVPRSPYAAAKAAGEGYCHAYRAAYGLSTVILRYFNVYGPGQRADGPAVPVIPAFINALLDGKRPVINGIGNIVRDFTYVEDVVDANIAAMNSAPVLADSGYTFDIGGGSVCTLTQLAETIGSIVGVDAAPMYVEGRVGDIQGRAADITRASVNINWSPQTTLHAGLEKTVEYYRALRG